MKPTKPKTPATTRALQAWQSELRRLESSLMQWQEDLNERDSELDKREAVLEEQEAAFADVIAEADDPTVERYASTWEDAHEDCDCVCDDEDAGGGCDCDKCENTRENWVKSFKEDYNFDMPRFHQPKPVIGDEIRWLEKLWKLKDSRKK
jgi:hypothetical protein